MDANGQVIHGAPTPPDEQQELTSRNPCLTPRMQWIVWTHMASGYLAQRL